MTDSLSAMEVLPQDHRRALLLGRIWDPRASGPSPVLVHSEMVYDLTPLAPTLSLVLDLPDLDRRLARPDGLTAIGPIAAVIDNSRFDRHDPDAAHLLAPCDLQAIKACGVTFVTSLLERVIEEQARGEAARADAVRAEITDILGADLSAIVPGSPEAAQIKQLLIAKGMWSQYLEVGIGPDAEIFTKAQPLSAVGHGAQVGVHPISTWNNPEPEMVLAIDRRGRILGASLGNDVNLRDVEGRSALLLGKAKDNNGACAIGPLLRLFDDHFTLADAARADITLTIDGEEGFHLSATSAMAQISRPPEALVAQAIGPHHQYPDGLMLFLGTMFAPIADRDWPGGGFTHKIGDRVRIASPDLGVLENWVDHADAIAPWRFGAGALMRNLAQRGAL